MTGTLCDLVATLPELVGTLLDRETTLKRGRFREETLTDMFVASLAAFAGPELVIQYPHEASTGGDIDLEFWNVETDRRVLLRLQAKRLNAAESRGKFLRVQNRSYQELLHKVPTTGEYQFEIFNNTRDGYVPLYIFYNHGSVVADQYYANKCPKVRGINLAFAIDVALAMEEQLRARPKVLYNKRLTRLQPLFFGLEEILCPGGQLAGLVPTPDAVSEALQNLWNNRVGMSESDKTTRSSVHYLRDQRFGESSPASRPRLPDGPAIRTSSEVKRCTITFISGSTRDEKAPSTEEPSQR